MQALSDIYLLSLLCHGFLRQHIEKAINDISSLVIKYNHVAFYAFNYDSQRCVIDYSNDGNLGKVRCSFETNLGSKSYDDENTTVVFMPFISQLFEFDEYQKRLKQRLGTPKTENNEKTAKIDKIETGKTINTSKSTKKTVKDTGVNSKIITILTNNSNEKQQFEITNVHSMEARILKNCCIEHENVHDFEFGVICIDKNNSMFSNTKRSRNYNSIKLNLSHLASTTSMNGNDNKNTDKSKNKDKDNNKSNVNMQSDCDLSKSKSGKSSNLKNTKADSIQKLASLLVEMKKAHKIWYR